MEQRGSHVFNNTEHHSVMVTFPQNETVCTTEMDKNTEFAYVFVSFNN